MKMWGGKLERIDMLYTIPESWEVVDSVFEWANLLSNKSGKTMCPNIYAAGTKSPDRGALDLISLLSDRNVNFCLM